jgi:hypothetical protein
LDAIDLAVLDEVESLPLLVACERRLGEVERGEVFFGADWMAGS